MTPRTVWVTPDGRYPGEAPRPPSKKSPSNTVFAKDMLCELVRENPGLSAADIQDILGASNRSTIPNALVRQIRQGRLIRRNYRGYSPRMGHTRSTWLYFAPDHVFTEAELARLDPPSEEKP